MENGYAFWCRKKHYTVFLSVSIMKSTLPNYYFHSSSSKQQLTTKHVSHLMISGGLAQYETAEFFTTLTYGETDMITSDPMSIFLLTKVCHFQSYYRALFSITNLQDIL